MENLEILATRRRKAKQKYNTICVGHHYAQANTNNVTLYLLQTIGDRYEPNILLMWKTQRTPQHHKKLKDEQHGPHQKKTVVN